MMSSLYLLLGDVNYTAAGLLCLLSSYNSTVFALRIFVRVDCLLKLLFVSRMDSDVGAKAWLFAEEGDSFAGEGVLN